MTICAYLLPTVFLVCWKYHRRSQILDFPKVAYVRGTLTMMVFVSKSMVVDLPMSTVDCPRNLCPSNHLNASDKHFLIVIVVVILCGYLFRNTIMWIGWFVSYLAWNIVRNFLYCIAVLCVGWTSQCRPAQMFFDTSHMSKCLVLLQVPSTRYLLLKQRKISRIN